MRDIQQENIKNITLRLQSVSSSKDLPFISKNAAIASSLKRRKSYIIISQLKLGKIKMTHNKHSETPSKDTLSISHRHILGNEMYVMVLSNPLKTKLYYIFAYLFKKGR